MLNKIKGSTDLLDQCESFRLYENKDGFVTYHGFSFDDEVIELVFVGIDNFYSIINNFDITNMLKKSPKAKLFVNYAIMWQVI